METDVALEADDVREARDLANRGAMVDSDSASELSGPAVSLPALLGVPLLRLLTTELSCSRSPAALAVLYLPNPACASVGASAWSSQFVSFVASGLGAMVSKVTLRGLWCEVGFVVGFVRRAPAVLDLHVSLIICLSGAGYSKGLAAATLRSMCT